MRSNPLKPSKGEASRFARIEYKIHQIELARDVQQRRAESHRQFSDADMAAAIEAFRRAA